MASIRLQSNCPDGANWICGVCVCGGRGGLMEVLRPKQLTFQQYEAIRVCESVALQIPPFSTNLLSNWKLIFSHCAPLLENKCSKIDLRSQMWSPCVELLHTGPFYSPLAPIYKHAKLASSTQNACTGSTCPITSLDGSFPAHGGAQHGSGSVEQCVLTSYRAAHQGCQAESAASRRIC